MGVAEYPTLFGPYMASIDSLSLLSTRANATLLKGYSTFYQMCDAIEGFAPNATALKYGDGAVGLEKALPNYAKWYTTNYLPGRKYRIPIILRLILI